VDEARFAVPRYTVPEAARYLDVHPETFRRWVDGYQFTPTHRSVPTVGKPIVHSASQKRHAPRLAFAGLVEGLVIDGLRRAGLSLQALRRITKTLQSDFGDEWALASHRLTLSGGAGRSGPEVLWDYAEEHGDDEVLIALDTKQRVFAEVVRDYLERIIYLDDYAGQLYLPLTRENVLLVDPYRNFGRPMFGSTATPVGPVLDRIEAGEPVGSVARDYGLDVDEIELVVRHAPAIAA
jgi:uncharacterized protein (DUF433 family)